MPPRPFNPDDLNRDDVFSRIRLEATDAVSYSLVRESWDLERGIEQALKEAEDQHEKIVREKEYRRILSELKAIALPAMNEREVIEAFKAIGPALSNPDIDLWERLRLHLIAIPALEDRDKLKQSILQTLRESDEVLTRSGIPEEGRVLPGTVANWIHELHRTVGTDVNTIRLAEFFSRSQAPQRLPETDRRLVQKFFEIYSRLHRSSTEIQGIEEEITVELPDGSLKLFSAGQFTDVTGGKIRGVSPTRSVRPSASVSTAPRRTTPITPPVSPRARNPVAQLMSRYEAFLKAQERLRPIEQQIQAETKGDFRKLKQTMGAGITGKDRDRTLACLRALARSGDLVRILEREQAVIKTLASHLAKKYSATPGVDQAIRVLNVNPVSPEALSEFLQYVLKARLGMNEEESALVGVELGLLLKEAGKPDFQHLAYADTKRLTFTWVSNRIAGSRFVREVA